MHNTNCYTITAYAKKKSFISPPPNTIGRTLLVVITKQLHEYRPVGDRFVLVELCSPQLETDVMEAPELCQLHGQPRHHGAVALREVKLQLMQETVQVFVEQRLALLPVFEEDAICGQSENIRFL